MSLNQLHTRYRKEMEEKGCYVTILKKNVGLALKDQKRFDWRYGNQLKLEMYERNQTLQNKQASPKGPKAYKFLPDIIQYWERYAKAKGLRFITHDSFRTFYQHDHYRLALEEAGYKPISEAMSEKAAYLVFGSMIYGDPYFKEVEEGFLTFLLSVIETFQQTFERMKEDEPTLKYEFMDYSNEENVNAFSYYYKGAKGVVNLYYTKGKIKMVEEALKIESEVTSDELEEAIIFLFDSIWKKTRARLQFNPPKEHLTTLLGGIKGESTALVDRVFNRLAEEFGPERVEAIAANENKRTIIGGKPLSTYLFCFGEGYVLIDDAKDDVSKIRYIQSKAEAFDRFKQTTMVEFEKKLDYTIKERYSSF